MQQRGGSRVAPASCMLHAATDSCSALVQVLQADGGMRCACINAAMLALAEAGALPRPRPPSIY